MRALLIWTVGPKRAFDFLAFDSIVSGACCGSQGPDSATTRALHAPGGCPVCVLCTRMHGLGLLRCMRRRLAFASGRPYAATQCPTNLHLNTQHAGHTDTPPAKPPANMAYYPPTPSATSGSGSYTASLLPTPSTGPASMASMLPPPPPLAAPGLDALALRRPAAEGNEPGKPR